MISVVALGLLSNDMIPKLK